MFIHVLEELMPSIEFWGVIGVVEQKVVRYICYTVHLFFVETAPLYELWKVTECGCCAACVKASVAFNIVLLCNSSATVMASGSQKLKNRTA